MDNFPTYPKDQAIKLDPCFASYIRFDTILPPLVHVVLERFPITGDVQLRFCLCKSINQNCFSMSTYIKNTRVRSMFAFKNVHILCYLS